MEDGIAHDNMHVSFVEVRYSNAIRKTSVKPLSKVAYKVK